jgi:spermidine synthase
MRLRDSLRARLRAGLRAGLRAPVAPAADAGVTLSESDGVRYLHFGTEWVQGAMQLAHPYRLELEYQQQMMAPLLFHPRPEQVVQLGLGAAALTKFCHRHLRGSRVLAVDIDSAVIRVARQSFALPPDDARLRVLQDDAGAYIRRSPASADWLQVDLYDAQARGPVFDDAPFYRACRDALRSGGVAAFNLFGRTLQPSLAAIGAAFGARWLRLPRSAAGNTVVLAFGGAPAQWDIDELCLRAQKMEQRFGLPALTWLQGMRTASARHFALQSRPQIAL